MWVLPEGQDQLTKLTLAILDYALHDPPAKRTKEVDYNIDEYGLPTTNQPGRRQGDGQRGDRRDVRRACSRSSQADEARIDQFLDYRHKHVKERLATTTNPQEQKQLLDEDQMLEAKLDFLHEQMAQGGLKEQFYPKSPIPSNAGVLQFDLQQNALTPQNPPIQGQ